MTKILLSVVLLTIVVTLIAQTPQAFKYQSVVRDNTGALLANQSVSFRIGIRNGSTGGTIVYQETHTTSTNEFGLANLEIGTQTPIIGIFSSINWGTGDKFLEIELDLTGNSSYVSMGTTQLLSVPFSLYSENAAGSSVVTDSDGDTYIITEETPDDDTIRFYTNGTESLKFDGERLEFVNNGSSVLIGKKAGNNNNPTNIGNTFVGGQSGYHNSTSGENNTFLGLKSGFSNTWGQQNLSLGSNSGYSNQIGHNNVSLGYNSGYLNTGDDNVFIGSESGYNGTFSDRNIFIGKQAGYNETGSDKLYIENSSAGMDDALIFGDFVADIIYINGRLRFNKGLNSNLLPEGRGNPGQVLATNSGGNLYWKDDEIGASGGNVSGTGTSNQVAFWTGTNTIAGDTYLTWNSSTNRLIFGTIAGTQLQLSSGNIHLPITYSNYGVIYSHNATLLHAKNGNTFVGPGAGNLTTNASECIGIGGSALTDMTNGYKNSALGHMALTNNTTGNSNTVVGNRVMEYNQTGSENIAIGIYTMYLGTNARNNISIGNHSGFNTTGTTNIFIGDSTGYNNTSGSNNIYLGQRAGFASYTGKNNIAIGDSAGYANAASNNIFLGPKSGYWNQSGNTNIYIGREAGYGNNGTPVSNLLIGYKSGNNITNGSNNVLLGNHTGNTLGNFTSSNVVVGDSAGYHLSGSENVYIGTSAGHNSNDINSSRNVFIGFRSGYYNTSGYWNVFIGEQSGLKSNGTHNVCVGRGAGRNLTTGYTNIFIGSGAGESYTTENNMLEIGTINTGKPKIWGDYSHVVIAGDGSDNPLGYTFFVNGPAGGTSGWNTYSDKNLKKDIVPIEDALNKIIQLQGINFKWKEMEGFDESIHMGFIAQEVEKVIPEVVKTNNEIYSMEYAPLTALLVEALKEQQAIIEDLKSRLESLENK